MTISLSAHTLVANPSASLPKAFLSAASSSGADGHREKVDVQGHQQLAGFMPIQRVAAVHADRSIRELTFGPSTVRGLLHSATVVGASGLVVVPDTTKYPWRAIAALRIKILGQADTFYATGWFIASYVVITAAHAVYPRSGSGGQWAMQIEVFPGLNGFDKASPYGSFTSNTFYCPTAWISDGDPRVDYGVILLSQGIGSKVGTFGYATYSDSDIGVSMANLGGYPVVAPDGVTAQGHLWYDAGTVYLDDFFLYYQLDTRDGQSGGCIYRNADNDCVAMAIHTGTDGSKDRAVRIIEPVFENLQKWAGMRSEA